MRPVLRNRDFLLAWTGGLVSMLGGWALWIALPLHVYQLSGSALATSGVVAALVAPGILFGSVAGVFVDRWNRKTTLVLANLVLAGATLPLLLVADESRLWVVYPIVFLLELVEQFTGPAENAFLPRLVPADELVAANSLNALNNNLARLGGPALGGALYAWIGLTGVVLANSISFLVAAALLAAIAASGAVALAGDAVEAAGRRWRRVWSELHDGLRVVRRRRALVVVFAVSALTSFGEGVMGVMFAVWVRDVLEGGVPALGLLQTSQAVGGLLGGIVGAYAGRHLAPERLFGVALLTFGILDLALFNFPLVFDGLWIGSALMILVGIPGPSTQAARAPIMPTKVEDGYLGRVFGSLGTSASLLMFVGTVAAGAVGGVLGPIALLNFQGGAYVVAGTVVLLVLAPSRAPVGEPASATTT